MHKNTGVCVCVCGGGALVLSSINGLWPRGFPIIFQPDVLLRPLAKQIM